MIKVASWEKIKINVDGAWRVESKLCGRFQPNRWFEESPDIILDLLFEECQDLVCSLVLLWMFLFLFMWLSLFCNLVFSPFALLMKVIFSVHLGVSSIFTNLLPLTTNNLTHQCIRLSK